MKRNERNTESVSGRHEAPAIGKETYSSYEEQPRPEKRKAKKKSFNATPILLLLVILFGAIFGYSAYRLYGMMSEYHVSRKRYNAVMSRLVRHWSNSRSPMMLRSVVAARFSMATMGCSMP